MIEDTIQRIEAEVRDAKHISPERRTELLKLLETLKTEVAPLSKTHEEQAESIAGFAVLSAHEAMRSKRTPELLKLSLKGLGTSVTEFEKTHPRLVRSVDAISQALSNLGI